MTRISAQFSITNTQPGYGVAVERSKGLEATLLKNRDYLWDQHTIGLEMPASISR